jgi:hypothetical protein
MFSLECRDRQKGDRYPMFLSVFYRSSIGFLPVFHPPFYRHLPIIPNAILSRGTLGRHRARRRSGSGRCRGARVLRDVCLALIMLCVTASSFSSRRLESGLAGADKVQVSPAASDASSFFTLTFSLLSIYSCSSRSVDLTTRNSPLSYTDLIHT